MKGFPRRGSDETVGTLALFAQNGLNEGLPQKGKRCGGVVGLGHLVGRASMKGFPRRGSD